VLASIGAATGAGEGVVLYARPATAVLRLTAPSRLVRIPFAALEAAISWKAEATSVGRLDPEVRRRAEWLRLAGPFWRLTLDEVVAVAEALEPVSFEAGAAIVTQGEKGEHFFVVETGRAEVWRTDPMTEETACVATLGPGDTFGEEALLQEGMRNATVKASAPCRLLRLGRQDFDRHVRAGLLGEIDAEDARRLLDSGAVGLVDCRYAIEHEASRIPGSMLHPLDRIRETGRALASGRRYIVYCRSGRRSRAAAFLLRQMGIDAISLRGGIGAWPFAVEGDADAH
jgi:CRP-like cAMP-binding protein